MAICGRLDLRLEADSLADDEELSPATFSKAIQGFRRASEHVQTFWSPLARDNPVNPPL